MKRALVVAACLLGGLAAVPTAADAAAPKATCTLSKVAFALPFPASDRSRHDRPYDFAQLTTTRAGTWAGIAYRSDNHTIHLISWRSHHKAVVLARYRYQGAYDPQRSVLPAGVTPGGAVVAAVQDPHASSGKYPYGRFVGAYWAKGKARHLAHRSTWWGWTPTAVTDSGRVVGYAATGSHTRPTYYAVTWASVRSGPTTLARLGTAIPTVTATGEGDLLWTRTDGYSIVKLRNGTVRTLTTAPTASGPSNVYPGTAGRTTVFASSSRGLLRWDLSRGAAGATDPTVLGPDYGVGNYPLVAGARGDLVIGLHNPARLRLATGAVAGLPKTLTDGVFPVHGIDAHGTVAYTSATDRHVHLAVCH